MTIIQFEDHGQDFLTWEVSKKGKVKSSQPFQTSIWSKYHVTNLADLQPGGLVEICAPGEEPWNIKYPIEHLETT